MTPSFDHFNIYLEVGKLKTFASVEDWPGWSRSGEAEELARQSLFDYAARYAGAIRSAKLGFVPPADIASFKVVDHLEGNSTTDFGAPAIESAREDMPLDQAELDRLLKILEACWVTFDQAVDAAQGLELKLGPRGGGRDIESIVGHVIGAEAAYLGRLGWKYKEDPDADPQVELGRARLAIRQALPAAAAGELPRRGPRGGIRWTPRFFVRRAAWHLLDHTWEIEDRVQ